MWGERGREGVDSEKRGIGRLGTDGGRELIRKKSNREVRDGNHILTKVGGGRLKGLRKEDDKLEEGKRREGKEQGGEEREDYGERNSRKQGRTEIEG